MTTTLRAYDPTSTGWFNLDIDPATLESPTKLAAIQSVAVRRIAEVSDLHWSEVDDLARRLVWTVMR